MASQFERISPVECQVKVEVPWSDVSPRLSKKLSDVRRRIRLPGFRPGKAPLRMVERMYGASVRHEVAEELVKNTFAGAAQEHDTVPLTEPRVEEHNYEEGKSFVYKARYEVAPVIEPKDYEGLEVFKLKVEVEEEKIEEWLKNKRLELSELHSVEDDRATQAGDVWVLDVAGQWGDMDLTRKDLAIDIGSEGEPFIPGFAKQIEGFGAEAVGTKKTIKFLPIQDNLREDLKDKELEIEVAFRERKQRVLPELNDDFAKDTELADSLDELKEKVKENFREEADIGAEREARLRLASELLHRNEVVPAPSMVMREVEAQYEMQVGQLRQQGIDLPSLAPENREEVYRAMWPRAYGNVAAFLLLDSIGKKEEITVTSEELEEELAELAKEQGTNVEKLRAMLQKSGELMLLNAQIRENKIFEFLMGKSKVSELAQAEYDAELEKHQALMKSRQEEAAAKEAGEDAPAEGEKNPA